MTEASIFALGGGYVFNTIHNIIIARRTASKHPWPWMDEAVEEFNHR